MDLSSRVNPFQLEKATSDALDSLFEKYQNHPEGVCVSFRDLCGSWPWAKRSDVYTHLIHAYPAKMLAYIPIFFQSTERFAKANEPILDVFAGSSTVLLESIAHPVFPRDAYGIEINPLARLVGKVKTTPIIIEDAKEAYLEVVNCAGKTAQTKIPEYNNIDYWFSPRIKKSLGQIAWAIDAVSMADDLRDFLLVCFSAIVKKCSLADPDIPVPVLLKLKKQNPNKCSNSVDKRNKIVQPLLKALDTIDPLEIFSDSVYSNLVRMRLFNEVMKGRATKATIICEDARCIQSIPMSSRAKFELGKKKTLPDNSVAMVITSPPYGSAQKYIRATRLEMLWTGLLTSAEITNLEKISIGTESLLSKDCCTLVMTGYPNIDDIIRQINDNNHYRASITSLYFNEMIKVFKEIKRVLKPGGELVLVIGDNESCDIEIQNHVFLASIANDLGLRQELLLRDPVKSRGMMTKRHKSAGMIADDWIILFKKDREICSS
jgi:hypothetical protein